MQSTIKDGGQYRINIFDYSLKETKTGSVMLKVRAKITHEAGHDGWEECDPTEVDGFLCVIKKDGNPNAFMVEALMNHAGWDGNLESLGNGGWEPTPCACTTARNEYNGDVKYQINFINSYDAVPQMGPERARELQAKFGAKLRSLGGSATPAAARLNAPPPGEFDNSSEIPF